MSKFQFLEKRLVQRLGGGADGPPQGFAERLFADIDKTMEAELKDATSAAEQRAEAAVQKLRDEMARIKDDAQRRVEAAQSRVEEAQAAMKAARDDMQRMHATHQTEMRDSQQRMMDEHQQRVKLEAEVGAARTLHEATLQLLKELRATPAAAPQVTVMAPKPAVVPKEARGGYTFTVTQRTPEGRIAAVTAKPS